MARAAAAITIPLQGGLGNQLFELAAGIAIGCRTSRRVQYSDYWLMNPVEGETPRAFALDALLRPGEHVGTPAPRVGQITDRLFQRRVIERGADDDPLARVVRRTNVLAGYFQRLPYVEEAWPDLHERLASSPHSHHRGLVSPTHGRHGAIHYRLGDYVSNSGARSHHGVTAPDYFIGVIRAGRERLGVTDWRVVSDDTASAVELLRSGDLPGDVDLSADPGGTEWGDLLTLASARILAISNSSFSWWAAFFGTKSASTHVVAPRPWFSDPGAAEPALFPAGWSRRPRQLL